MQVCPALRKREVIAPCAACSMSASSKMSIGAWPPSSSETFLTVPAAIAISSLPTSVLPVKVILRTMLLSASTFATSFADLLVTILTTPGGNPASSNALMISSATSGVADEGRSTTVQPAASAGAILRVIIE